MPLVIGQQIVACVVDPPEGQGRPQFGPFGGVVVDHVQDHLDPGLVQAAHDGLHLIRAAGFQVLALGGKEGQGVVAPVILQPLVQQHLVMQEPMDRQKLDRRDTDLLQMLDHRIRPKAGQEAAVAFRDFGMQHGGTLGMGLPDQGVFPAMMQGRVGVPVEIGVGDDGFRHEGAGIAIIPRQVIAHMAEDRRVPDHLAPDFAGVGVQKQLCRVEAMARLGFPRAMDAVAVDLTGEDPRQVAEPDAALHVGQVVAGDLGLAFRIVETKLDPCGVLRKKGEVRAFAVKVRANRVGTPLRRIKAGRGDGFVDHGVLILLRKKPAFSGRMV